MKSYLKIITVLLFVNCSISLFAQEIKEQKTIMDVEITVFENKIVVKNISNDKRVVKAREIFDNKTVNSGVINCEKMKENSFVFKNKKSRVEIEILQSYDKSKNVSFTYIIRE